MKKVIIIAITLFLSFALISCGSYIADNTEHYDDITKTLKLSKSYEGKSFLTDGIGEATVVAYTDGDTTRFLLSNGEQIVVRYYSVDTKESTGDVEKWGKAASNFTKDQLKKAEKVVLEATDSTAQHDSYGVRYLGYVWYREAANQDFKCLNLELVENGYSENTGSATDKFPYNSYFDKANKFAQSIKLRLYSDLDDPLFSKDPIPMTIKEFRENPDAYYNSDTESGSKVKITGYLASLHISSSGTYTFTASQVIDGQVYNIDLYAGYVSAAASSMPIGHLYEIVGLVAKHNGSYQLSGISYNPIYQQETHIVQRDYYLTFDSSVKYMSQYKATLFSDITVTEVTVDGNTIKFKGNVQQVTANGLSEEVKNYSFSVTKPDNYNDNIGVGTVISCNAYQFTAKSGEFTVLQYSSLRIK